MAETKKAAAAKTADKLKRAQYLVIPRNQDTYNEKYAIANGKKCPFEVPVTLTGEQVEALKHQKEPFQTEESMTIYDVMEKFSVDQEKAAQIMKAQSVHKELNNSSIKWRNKYLVQAI